mmetsp:Transcript_32188/g.44654  ORF Transcript_32188/g.44654 Transcript_32188/m.44654 type:complete len:968 (-) Transcript_32188:442-3345(-)|eukprot:CAMPEP_0196583528 /NCGR_PEP_ID=MMETSP1081-20130531/43885_1 /TAXON_ID=36882 /ORGANISM="Pyramimonas amylifera, Strain CCMP720" /LENGTH=967 /DNA_ID=CAMNT_0041904449 /DNA_START=44 /DNA_END=2947 /DNA_ORIENTATION=-
MPLRLDIKRKLVQRSDRVKSVELHPTEPWILANLYSGNIYIWNHVTNTLVKSFEVTELPVRSAKFIVRKQWIVCGADDMFIRVYNYNTSEQVKVFEAHTDYIRCIAVHPTLPYILSCSDDMLIKLWDWDKGWQCTQVFEGHSHYVMQVAFNPKDSNTFASASLDRTIKVWSLGQAVSNFTLEGHEKGVNCVDYFPGGDRPYLISGADDKLVKIWDYQTKSCVQTLEGHSHNVSAVCFHPELPIIVTGSEDGTLRLWHNTTYRLENTLNYGLERVWALAVHKGSNNVAVGYDEGTVMFKIGREEPVASMDNSGKIIWARHNEIQTVNIRSIANEEVVDGERIPLAVKDLGSCDLYPQALVHNPNGRFVVVCGDGEYIIYTALAWRNKTFGTALDFAWSSDSSEFATRESPQKIKVFKNFQERKSIRPNFSAERIHGGPVLAACSTDFVCFYDWQEARVIRRIDVAVKDIFWSESGEYVAIACEASFYILRYNREAVDEYLSSVASGEAAAAGEETDGLEDAFDLLHEIGERVRTATWAGDCFIYNNQDSKLNYCVGGEVTTIFHLDRPMYILGYMASQNRLYLIDREFCVMSYTLLMSAIEFKTLVLRSEVDAALELLSGIPEDQHSGLARFLEARGHSKEALQVAIEPDYKFDLAIQLGELAIAREIASGIAIAGSEGKWKQLGELAMSSGDLILAESCLNQAQDLGGLLLLYSATANADKITELAELAKGKGKHNVAFLSLFILNRLEDCIQLLCDTGRIPEAAFMARTYLPSRASSVVSLWRDDLRPVNRKAAEALADPAEYPNLFPNWELALQAEQMMTQRAGEGLKPAGFFPTYEANPPQDPIQELIDIAEGKPTVEEEEAEEEEGLVEEEEAEEEEEEGEERTEKEQKPVVVEEKPVVAAPVAPVAPAMKEEDEVFEEAEDQEEEEEEEDDEDLDVGDDDEDDEDVGDVDLDDDWGLEEDKA